MNPSEAMTILIQSVLVPALVYGILLLRNYILSKIKNEQVARALKQANDAAVLVVQETMQTFVDAIKGTVEWDAEAKQKAFSLAFSKAKGILSQESFKLLQTVTGDAKAYLTAAIEAAVNDYKTNVTEAGYE